MWLVQTGKGKGAYVTRYSLPNETQAVFYYRGLNAFDGYKKRLIDPTGRVVARYISHKGW